MPGRAYFENWEFSSEPDYQEDWVIFGALVLLLSLAVIFGFGWGAFKLKKKLTG